jgi:hypothetical protein
MMTILLAKGDDAIPPVVAGPTTEVTATLTNPFVELLMATLILVPVIVIHGWCLGRVSRFFSGHFALYTSATPLWRVSALTGTTIAVLVLIHLMETLLWTIPLTSLGMIGNFRDAYYYVLEAYTTLGEGNIALPDQWRLIGPVIAISGLFTFGWTGSVLVYVMTEIGKFHAARSKDEARTAAAGKGAEEHP